MKEMNVHDELASLVPPASHEPAMPDLVARARGVQRRRAAVVASASVAVVVALAVATPMLDVFRADGSTNIVADDPGDTTSADDADGESDLECSSDEGVTVRTVYAPPVLETPRAALHEELGRRRLSVTADDFTTTHESDDEVRYEVRREGEVLAIAVASRSDDGWTLDILSTCASLDD